MAIEGPAPALAAQRPFYKQGWFTGLVVLFILWAGVVLPLWFALLPPAAAPSPAAPQATAPAVIAPPAPNLEATVAARVQATLQAVAPTPAPTVAPRPDTVALAGLVDASWGTDWPTAIGALEQLLVLAPRPNAYGEKLYAAHLFYADQLRASGTLVAEQGQVEKAIALDPSRSEAQERLAEIEVRKADITAQATAVAQATATAKAKPSPLGVPPSGRDCPPSHPLKGMRGSREQQEWIYYLPNQGKYAQTDPDECFATAADAQEAGYHARLF